MKLHNLIKQFILAVLVIIGFGCSTDSDNRLIEPEPDDNATGHNGVIAFSSDRSGNMDIWVMDSDGSNQIQLTNNHANDWLPDWSPDGMRILFISERNGNFDVFLMDEDGANETCLTPDSPSLDYQATWSPDGLYIAYQTSYGNNNDEIAIMEIATRRQTRLTTDLGWDTGPSWR